MRFEFKLPPGANNGLGIRTPRGVNAAYNGMELQILDNTVAASGQGLQADFVITNFSRSEPLKEGMTVSVTARIGYSDDAPQWLE